MKYIKGKIEDIEVYRGYRIVIEHNLNIMEKTKDTEYPIYTICKMGRSFQGTVNDVKEFIDDMFIKYS